MPTITTNTHATYDESTIAVNIQLFDDFEI